MIKQMENTNFSIEQVEKFIKHCSPAGLLAIYAVSISFNNQKAFDRVNFGKDVYPTGPEYFYGFIVACHAINIIHFNFKGAIITITYVDELLESHTKAKLKELEENDDQVKSIIKKIDEYFD